MKNVLREIICKRKTRNTTEGRQGGMINVLLISLHSGAGGARGGGL